MQLIKPHLISYKVLEEFMTFIKSLICYFLAGLAVILFWGKLVNLSQINFAISGKIS